MSTPCQCDEGSTLDYYARKEDKKRSAYLVLYQLCQQLDDGSDSKEDSFAVLVNDDTDENSYEEEVEEKEELYELLIAGLNNDEEPAQEQHFPPRQGVVETPWKIDARARRELFKLTGVLRAI